MARPIEEFIVAWEALSGRESDTGGWRGIPVAPAGTCQLVAARRFPGNEEALLACFPNAKLAAAEQLPEGRGFEVVKADPHGDRKTWIALSRRESGSPELFAEMVGDVAGAMDVEAPLGEERTLRAMLRRVRMWQAFMGKGAQPLGPEAELGLFGEISFLAALLNAGVATDVAVEAWLGPDDTPQDFVLGEGAVEVKATLASTGFPAKIGSLEQLDDAIVSPLFVAGLRFAKGDGGTNLPELVAEMETQLSGDPLAVTSFREKTFAAGYHCTHAERYVRRFMRAGFRTFRVNGDFPRLVLGNVPEGVSKATYEIDLTKVSAFEVAFDHVLKELGAI